MDRQPSVQPMNENVQPLDSRELPAAAAVPAESSVPADSAVPAGRLLLAALGMGLAAEILLFGVPLGINFPIWVALVLGAAWITRRAGTRTDPLDGWIIVGALVFAALVALRSDPLLVLFDLLTATALSGGAVLAIAGVPVTRRSIAGIVWIGSWLAALIVRGAAPLLIRLGRGGIGRNVLGSSRAWAVVRGLLLAVPALIVFGLLFASADAVFARLAADVVHVPDLRDLPDRLIFAGFAAWASAAVLWLAAGGRRPDSTVDSAIRDASAGPRAVQEPSRRSPLFDGVLPILGGTEAVVVLLAVDLLFALFVALQVAYLFGGRDTLAASGLTYSDYARRGFFELIAVVVLVGALLVALETAVVRRTSAYIYAAIALVALATVVLASAFLRLRLYQDAYGWTELRFYALAAIVWLAACLAIAAVTLLAGRTRWLLHGVAVAALVIAVMVNVLDPPAFVARENIARALEPSRVPEGGETGFDAVYLSALGYDAVPVILDALPRLTENERAVLRLSMNQLRDKLRRNAGTTTWQGWNLAREHARERLELDLGAR
jgi:uncharacterized protein DUF4153